MLLSTLKTTVIAKLRDAIPASDDDWGTDRQIEAENSAFDLLGEVGIWNEELDARYFKATVEERCLAMIALVSQS